MRWRYVWPALALLAVPACDGLAPSGGDRSGEDVIAGGFVPGDLEDEGAQTAFSLVQTAIYDRYPSPALVDTVQMDMQVVAGLNYRFRIEMTGAPESRAIYEAVVYRDLDDNYEITSLNRLQ